MHNNKDDFYIGYLAEAPTAIAKYSRWFILLLVLLVPALAFVLVSNQKGFEESTFEVGQYRQLEGLLYTQPVPHLKLSYGQNPKGMPLDQLVILIGFGKLGALSAIRRMEERQGQSLEGQKVRLEGTMIYYDGKALLELTEDHFSLLEVLDGPSVENVSQVIPIGKVQVEGEIIDPKCYFGVMKPGYGKPHRSCAIRCISGGVPPVLKVENKEGERAYYLLLGEQGEAVNQAVLDFVGEPLRLEGDLGQLGDWGVLRMKNLARGSGK